MSFLASNVLKYIKDNHLSIPISVEEIKIDSSLQDIYKAILELENLGYVKLSNLTTDQEYPVIGVINELD